MKLKSGEVDTGEAAMLPARLAPPYAVTLEKGRGGELRLGPLTPAAAGETDRQ